MKDILKGIVFDVKRYAIDDGPGIRTTLFLKGCPLSCWWCHNPEGQCPNPELMYRQSRCRGSGECIESCPANAISRSGGRVRVNRKLCDLCGKCAAACPTGALAVIGRAATVDEVLEEIEKDVPFYDESGGGVTFSGGEPLVQTAFLEALLDECKERGIRTALDTCGFASCKTLKRVERKVDLFLYDIKTLDDRVHRRYTGVSNRLVVRNFERLAKNGNRIFVRFPVIPGVNDDAKSVTEIGEFAVLHRVEQVCLLPYHRAGIEKYKGLDRVYRLEGVESPSDASMREIKEKLITLGLEVKIGGG